MDDRPENQTVRIKNALPSTNAILVVFHDVADESRLIERLKREPGLALIGVTSNPGDAIANAIQAAPGVVLKDLDLPGESSLDGASQQVQLRPRPEILRTGERDAQDISRTPAFRVRSAPKNVAGMNQDRTVLDHGASGVSRVPMPERREGGGQSAVVVVETGSKRLSTLTPRELEVLKLIANGLPQKRIADQLGISIKTVDNHRSNLMNKLDVHDRVCLARFAIRERLVEV